MTWSGRGALTLLAAMAVLVTGCAVDGGTPHRDPSASAPTAPPPPDASPTAMTSSPTTPTPTRTTRSAAGPTATTSTPTTTSVDISADPTQPPPRPTSTTPPTSPAGPPAGIRVTEADRARAASIVLDMSVRERAESVLMVTAASVRRTSLADHHFGGVILFAPGGIVDGTTDGTPAQVASATAALQVAAAADPTGVPILIATDQEYGLVQRLRNGFTAFPSAAEMAAIRDTDRAADLLARVTAAAGQEMRAVGVTVDVAPVADILPADGSPSGIGKDGRSYGADPQRVARLVAAAVTGFQAGGVAATLKHFPGLGRIAADTHVSLPTLDVACGDWNTHEAVPMRAGVDAGAAMVMTGHVLLPAVGASETPASISPEVVDGLLRGSGVAGCDGMGFDGVTVTDSLQMAPITDRFGAGGAAVAALRAGQDLLLMPADPLAAVDGIVAAVASGELAPDRLAEAATAVLALRIALARVPQPPLDIVGSAAHRQLADEARSAAG